MLERDKSILLVIDIQDKLLPKDAAMAERFLAKAIKLIRSAQCLHVPILVSEQNPEKLGGTNARVSEALGDIRRTAKMEFGCMANAEFRDALAATGRRQLLATGMETHVCVMQTVLAALEAGYEVFVARDAVASMEKDEYQAGLERMSGAGAALVTVQMAVFEWLRAAGTPEFRSMLPLLK